MEKPERCNGCEYADVDKNSEGNEIFYCIYSAIECNPSYEK